MENVVDLSIIIVPYNNKDLLRKTLAAVFASRMERKFEVIVHDNGSSDGTPDMVVAEFPEARLIRSENVGFTRGNNAGIKIARGRNILLLNPDTEVGGDTLAVMLNLLDRRPDIGVATCKLVLGNGRLDPACRRSFPTPWVAISRLSGLSLLFPKSRLFNRYNLGYLPEDQEYEIDSCSGAFLLIRQEVINKIGPLDEDFFMYNEDVDWCYRAKKAGYKIYYYPLTTTVHHKRQSAQFSKKAQWEFHRSMIVFHKKHLAGRYPWFVNLIAYVGPRVRYVLKLVWSYLPKIFSTHKGGEFKRRF